MSAAFRGNRGMKANASSPREPDCAVWGGSAVMRSRSRWRVAGVPPGEAAWRRRRSARPPLETPSPGPGCLRACAGQIIPLQCAPRVEMGRSAKHL